MEKKSVIEMERMKLAKATRALIRLKHSLAADEELNEILPDKINAFDAAIQQGEIKQLNIGLDLLNEE
jgi:hypothetical protein